MVKVSSPELNGSDTSSRLSGPPECEEEGGNDGADRSRIACGIVGWKSPP